MAAITEQLAELLRAAGISGDIVFSTPPKPELGDFAFSCFALAKEQKKNPNEVAQELVSGIRYQVSGIIESIKAFGPYMNFFLKAGAVAKLVIEEVQKRKAAYGTNTQGKGQSVLIEYPSNNTHKEFHIGHFRNVCIGNTLVSLYRASGFKTHPVNYLNDFGAHVAKCLWGLETLHKNDTPPANKQRWLGDVYAEAHTASQNNPTAEKAIAELQTKLEAHDKTIWPVFMETRQWSLEQFDRLFAELNVEHEAVFYEKDLKPKGQAMVDDLLRQGIATEGEGGAIVVDLKPYSLDIALVRKSNGAGLYITSDLALAQEKFKKFKVNESIVITGQEQTFYFKQLHKIIELMGFHKKLTHIPYGLVTRPEGKMSSRLGNVILYEDLRDEVFANMSVETKNRHPDWDKKQLEETALTLTLAALKFDMQKHEAAKNIVFDIKEATSFEGFSGLYILYVVARINSLVRKAGDHKQKKVSYDLLKEPEAKQLVLLMAAYEEAVKKALADYNPSTIARYCFDVAQAFNSFYNKLHILDESSAEVSVARLALCLGARQVLVNALGLLTIETVDEM